MKYLNKKTKSLLAAEYVLGLLQGKAKIRFETLLQNDASLNYEVIFWRDHFYALNECLQPKAPPESVWRNICDRIGLNQNQPSRRFSFGWEYWNGFISAGVMAFVIGFFVFNGRVDQIATISVNDYIAVLENQQSQPVLIASVNEHESSLVLHLLKPLPADFKRDLQLWCLPKTDEAPMPMGLVNRSGVTKFVLSKQEMLLLKDARALAISLEPKGGSKQPTGPILYSGLSI